MNMNDNNDHHAPPPPQFTVEDKVFRINKHKPQGDDDCKSKLTTTDDRYYESVVRKAKYDAATGQWLYLVHYLGWNNRWDEWIDATQLLTPQEHYLQTGVAEAVLHPRQRQQQDHEQQENSNNATCSEDHIATNAAAAAAGSSATSATIAAAGTTALALSSNSTTCNIANNSSGSTGKRSRTMDCGGNDPMDPVTTTKAAAATTTTSSPRKRRRAIQRHSGDDADAVEPLLLYTEYCELPLTLKIVLVEESERLTTTACTATTEQRWVHALPAAVPVSKVLHHFAKKKCKELMKQQEQHQQSLVLDENNSGNITTNINNNKHTLTPERVKEFVQGLGQIFNEALSTCLLYPQEQPQYKAWMLQQQQQQENSGTNQALVDCYGCEYLLRLLVRLPMLLHPHTSSHSHLWWSQPHLMGPLVAELIVLMQKNRPALFSATGNYRRPEPHEQFAWELPTSQRTTESMDTR